MCIPSRHAGFQHLQQELSRTPENLAMVPTDCRMECPGKDLATNLAATLAKMGTFIGVQATLFPHEATEPASSEIGWCLRSS